MPRTQVLPGHEQPPEEREPDYDFKGIWIPRDILWIPDLSHLDQKVYGLLRIFPKFEEGRGCWPSNKYLADHLGVTTQSITNSLKHLRECGCIVDYGSGNQGKRDRQRGIKYTAIHKERYAGSIRNVMNLLENIRESKDSLDKSKEPQSDPAGSAPKTSGVSKGKKNPLIEHWNSLPHTPMHSNRSSKVYKRASKLLSYLRHGQLGAKCTIDRSWLKKKDISIKWLTRKNSDAQIKRGLEFLARLFDPAYWDGEKYKIPRNLGDLIYNPRARNSWYLACVSSPPKPLDVKFQDPRRTEGENRLLDLFEERGEKEANQLKTIRGRIQTTEKWYNLVVQQKRYKDFRDYYPHFGLFLLDYIEHLEENPDIPVHPAFLGPEAHHWNTRILDWIYDHINVKISPIDVEESDD